MLKNEFPTGRRAFRFSVIIVLRSLYDSLLRSFGDQEGAVCVQSHFLDRSISSSDQLVS